MSETLNFQTEVKELLHLVIHSLYSNKEIFLRELISNASDALDKLRFIALSDNKLYEDDHDLKIRVDFDEKQQTITISDNGIGMSREEIITNLGTIAKSGTRDFLSQLSGDSAKDSQLIGQFGVGFYSAFIVADKVTVNSRRAGSPANQSVRWISQGDGEYSIDNISKPSRGTEIILHLKKDESSEFLNAYRLRSIINKYSDHIGWPIIMSSLPETDQENEDEKSAEPKEETVNKATALWTLSKKEISDEEYKTFYKHISHDFDEPLLWNHNHVEGKHQYITLLYIPSRAPFDIWQQDYKRGLKLYIKRVFIMDDADQFLPRYLRFVKGIVDSSDLPLNISREILQDNKLVETIRKACIKRILNLLDNTAKENPEKYAKFWEIFGLILKEGPIEDYANREDIAKLLRFSSTHTDSTIQNVSLDDYIARMPKEQEKIFYITADSFNAAKNSPHLEIFRKKNIEVLLLHDRIDEWLTGHLSEYNGKHLQSITKGEIDLGNLEDKEEKETQAKEQEEFESLIKHIKEILGDMVKEVRVTHRLTSSPACIVADNYDMGREMQRILKAAGQDVPESKPIFEINPHHALIQRMNNETDDARFADWSRILYDQAVLAEGGQLDNPAEFVQRLNKMLLELAG